MSSLVIACNRNSNSYVKEKPHKATNSKLTRFMLYCCSHICLKTCFTLDAVHNTAIVTNCKWQHKPFKAKKIITIPGMSRHWLTQNEAGWCKLEYKTTFKKLKCIVSHLPLSHWTWQKNIIWIQYLFIVLTKNVSSAFPLLIPEMQCHFWPFSISTDAVEATFVLNSLGTKIRTLPRDTLANTVLFH